MSSSKVGRLGVGLLNGFGHLKREMESDMT